MPPSLARRQVLWTCSLVFLLRSLRECSVFFAFFAVSYILVLISVGDLRFRLPVPIKNYTGIHDASKSGPSCPQLTPLLTVPEGLSPHATGYTTMIHAADFESEDCESSLLKLWNYKNFITISHQV
jgi:Carboxylesterase family